MASTSDSAFALLQVKRSHDHLLKLLSTPEVQKQLGEIDRDGLNAAERILAQLRIQLAEAVGHEITIR